MISFDYLITDPSGLHARPAGLLVKKMQEYPCKVTLTKGEKTVDAKKLFAVMSLALKQGDSVTVAADGDDAEVALQSAKAILEQ